MSAYTIPIITAVFLFPILAALAVLPYSIIQYRRFGAISKLKVVVLFSFSFYLLCAYFLIILPLPPRSVVAQLTTPRYNLMPLTALRLFLHQTVLRLDNPHTYLPALMQNVFLQQFFNLLLTLPFGVYLRYIWKRKWYQVLLASFSLSLFFELTQLSGLYFIYSRPYRLFDVDDLILNTTGGMLGFWLAPIFTKFIPSIEQLNADAVANRFEVSFWRRLVGLAVDMIIFNSIFIALYEWQSAIAIDNYWYYLIGVVLYFVLIPTILKGQTIGKHLVKIRIVNQAEQPANFGQLLVRQGLLFGLVIGNWMYLSPQLLRWFVADEGKHLNAYMTVLALAAIFTLICVGNMGLVLINHRIPMFYDRIAKTHEIGH